MLLPAHETWSTEYRPSLPQRHRLLMPVCRKNSEEVQIWLKSSNVSWKMLIFQISLGLLFYVKISSLSWLKFVNYFVPGRVRCDEYMFVCLFVLLSVCPVAWLENRTAEVHQIFCACCLWPWLGPPFWRSICYVLPVLRMTSWARIKHDVMFRRDSSSGGTSWTSNNYNDWLIKFVSIRYGRRTCYLRLADLILTQYV